MLNSLVVHHKEFDPNFYLKIAVLIKTESNLFQVKMLISESAMVNLHPGSSRNLPFPSDYNMEYLKTTTRKI